MAVRERIITEAERVFDQHGFAGTGVDQLTTAAGVSSRTLYKHLISKTGLIAAVLDARRERFLRELQDRTVDGLFAALADWIAREGARGCLFLRALGEDAGSEPDVAAAVAAYRAQLRATVAQIVERETGARSELLADQLLVLFEGATSAASYRGEVAVEAAREAAAALVRRHIDGERSVPACT
jgi:AcrR family transcriptional regulator